MMPKTSGICRVGIGGWAYKPWEESFYPKKLPKSRQLEYAANKLTSIEVNSTYYRLQKPETFARWREQTPDDFVFSLKAPRFSTNRRILAEAGPSIERFISSGLLELKNKLGVINWQFMPTKSFDPDDFESFLKLLPKSVDGHALRHAVEVRHDSFCSPDFIALLREYEVAVVIAADSQHPQIADITAPFVYLRVMGAEESEPLGYSDQELDHLAACARSIAEGRGPQGLKMVAPPLADQSVRDVFIYFISGYKAHNPRAAMALIDRLK